MYNSYKNIENTELAYDFLIQQQHIKSRFYFAPVSPASVLSKRHVSTVTCFLQPFIWENICASVCFEFFKNILQLSLKCSNEQQPAILQVFSIARYNDCKQNQAVFSNNKDQAKTKTKARFRRKAPTFSKRGGLILGITVIFLWIFYLLHCLCTSSRLLSWTPQHC